MFIFVEIIRRYLAIMALKECSAAVSVFVLLIVVYNSNGAVIQVQETEKGMYELKQIIEKICFLMVGIFLWL